MPEGLNPNQEDAYKGDLEGVHNEEFQKELREAGQEEKEFELTPEIEEKIMERVKDAISYGEGYTVLKNIGRIDPSGKDNDSIQGSFCDILNKGLL